MNQKIKAQLLADFKKANKANKLKQAKELNFTDTESYLKFLGGIIKAPIVSKKKPTVPVVVDETPQDKAIAFDTTGSMASYINNVKDHVKTLIPELFKNTPNLRIKVVAFGDYCDMKSPTEFGKAYQESELTNDENALIDFINKAQSTSGGDTPEFYELVIKKITEETPWREGSKRSVLLIADHTPHEVGHQISIGTRHSERNQIDWRVEANKAKDLGIQFDTLQIVPYIEWYKELSEITGGVNMPFKSSEKMSNIVEASTYARGTSVETKERFRTMTTAAFASGDEELIGTYKSLGKLTDDK